MKSFQKLKLRNIVSSLSDRFTSHCESSETDLIQQVHRFANLGFSSILHQADAKLESERPRIKAPMSFDGLKNTLNNAGVASFDGFRMAVQKQINLNTVTSHL